MPLPPPLTVTDTAAQHVQALLAGREKDVYGVRISVKSKGCSGLSYTLEFADGPQPFEEEVACENGVRILIDPKAVMFILGSEMDYEESDLEQGFVFRNPNEKGRCGCGESFHV